MSGFGNRLFQSAELRQEMKINPRLYQAMELASYASSGSSAASQTGDGGESHSSSWRRPDVEQEVSLEEAAEAEEKESSESDEIDWEEILA